MLLLDVFETASRDLLWVPITLSVIFPILSVYYIYERAYLKAAAMYGMSFLCSALFFLFGFNPITLLPFGIALLLIPASIAVGVLLDNRACRKSPERNQSRELERKEMRDIMDGKVAPSPPRKLPLKKTSEDNPYAQWYTW